MKLFIVLIVIGYLLADVLTAYITNAQDSMILVSSQYSMQATNKQLSDRDLIDVCELDRTLMGCGDPSYK